MGGPLYKHEQINAENIPKFHVLYTIATYLEYESLQR